jgi:hypothetical protein
MREQWHKTLICRIQLAIIGCALSDRVVVPSRRCRKRSGGTVPVGKFDRGGSSEIQADSAIFSASVSSCLPGRRARIFVCGCAQPLAFYRSPDIRLDNLDRVPIRSPRADDYWNLLWCCWSVAGQPDRTARSGGAKGRCRSFVVGEKSRFHSLTPATGVLSEMACWRPLSRVRAGGLV